MSKPDVTVIVVGGVAHVVSNPGVLVEVRDYDEVAERDHEDLWQDEKGEWCRRYQVGTKKECNHGQKQD